MITYYFFKLGLLILIYKIAEAMKSELTSDEMARINEKLTESTEAYEYYLKGNMYDNSGH